MKINASSPQSTSLRITGPAKSAGGSAASESYLAFKMGQLVRARVLRVLGGGEVVLEIAGKTLSAASYTELAAGMDLWLEVRESGETPVLVPAGRKAAAAALLRHLLSGGASLSKGVADLTSLPVGGGGGEAPASPVLGEVALGADPQPGRIVELLLGSFLPPGGVGKSKNPLSRLARLFPLLKDADGAGPDQAAGHDRSTLDGLAKLAGLLESVQALNGQAATPDSLPFFLFPCFFLAGAGWGQWLYCADQPFGGGEGYNLDFFLEMSRLGDVHVALEVAPARISGHIQVERVEVREFLGESLVELNGILRGLGYEQVGFSCSISKDSLLQELKKTIEEKARLRSIPLVDVRT